MSKEDHHSILLQGREVWNDWRAANPHLMPLLSGLDLRQASFQGLKLANVTFSRANLSGVDLRNTDLYQAEFYTANLKNAVLDGCDLAGAKFHNAQLTGASLRAADLFRADFIGTSLTEADLSEARCQTTTFASVDLTTCRGLDKVKHTGPSNIDVATLVMLGDVCPREFLLGAGIPVKILEYLPYFAPGKRAIDFQSCFISYSHEDEDFVRLLYRRLCEAGLRVWFAPEELKGGERLFDQIDQAIQLHDKLLLVLSEASMRSAWVERELMRARARELAEDRRILFPIRLTSFDALRDWVLIDSDSGRDIAREVRAYFIPDFSCWKEGPEFQKAVQNLLVTLRGGNEVVPIHSQ